MLETLTSAVPLALAGTSFALGVRHGLDWDHIAAITDLTAPRKDDETGTDVGTPKDAADKVEAESGDRA